MNKISYSIVHYENYFSLFFLSHLRKILFRLYNLFRQSFRLNIWSIKDTFDSENNLKILFIGNSTDHKYFSNLFFQGHADVTFIGKMWLWNIFFYLLRFRKQYDILICQNKINICNLLSSNKRFVIPDWVSCEIDLPWCFESSKLYRKNLKQNIKRVMKNGFTYFISKDPNDFHFFYNQMYRPYVFERHKDDLVRISYDTIKENFDNGELLLIKDGQKIIAGGIINYSVMNGIPRLTQLGVYKGDYNYVKAGALSAFYYYTIKYLTEKNYVKLSLGGTRPFFNDGVLKHKVSWGAKIVNESSNAFLLCLLSEKKCLKTFLSNNPFSCIKHEMLSLAIYDSETTDDVIKLPVSKNKLYSCGIDNITMVRI